MSNSTLRRPAFSLLEIMIAIGVLGIGLIMVAAIFPIALTQHRDSIEKSRSLDMLNKAEALLRSRIDASRLTSDSFVQPGSDSPWYMLPMANLTVNSNGLNAWDRMPATTPYFNPIELNPALAEFGIYANCLNGCRPALTFGATDLGFAANAFSWTGMPSLEQLSDRKAPSIDSLSPMTDSEFQSLENRFAWVGFYRRLAGGATRYTVAVNRILRDERYAEQDMTTLGVAGPGFGPQAGGNPRRLPVPWRLTVGYDPVAKRMFNTAAPEGLGELAPPGARIMIGGLVWRNAPSLFTMPTAPAGRIFTVTNVFDNTNDGIENPNIVDFLEDPTGLPTFDIVNDPPEEQYSFDIIVFPPPFVDVNGTNVRFARKSPLIQWKVNL